MANTFSQIYLQFVFAVKHRESLISKEHKEELHKYITSLVQARKAKMLAVYCMPDHIHLFVGFKPSVLISDFVKEIKVESNHTLLLIFIALMTIAMGLFPDGIIRLL